MANVLDNWNLVQQDPRFGKLDANTQAGLKDFYYKNVVLKDPQVTTQLQQNPTFAPWLMNTFYHPELAQRAQLDEAAQQRNQSLKDQPVQEVSGRYKGQTMMQPFKSSTPGVRNGILNTVDDLTSIQNLSLLGGMRFLAPAVSSVASKLGLGTNAAVRTGRAAEAAVNTGFAGNMAYGTMLAQDPIARYNDAADQAHAMNDASSEEYYRGMARQLRTQQILGGVLTLGGALGSYKAGKSAAFDMPTPAESVQLQRLGYNPSDFKGRLADVEHTINNGIRAPQSAQRLQFTPDEEGASGAADGNSTPTPAKSPLPRSRKAPAQSAPTQQSQVPAAVPGESYKIALADLQNQRLKAQTPEEQAQLDEAIQYNQTALAQTMEQHTAPAPETPKALAPPSLTLPQPLQGAKPNYQTTPLSFDSDIDKALYIVAQKTPSKADGSYMGFLRPHFPGLGDDVLRMMGTQVRNENVRAAATDYDPSSGAPTAQVPMSDWAKNAHQRNSAQPAVQSPAVQAPVTAPAPAVPTPKPTPVLPAPGNNGISPEVNRRGITQDAATKGIDAFVGTLHDDARALLQVKEGLTPEQFWHKVNSKNGSNTQTDVTRSTDTALAVSSPSDVTKSNLSVPNATMAETPQSAKSRRYQSDPDTAAILADIQQKSNKEWISQLIEHAVGEHTRIVQAQAALDSTKPGADAQSANLQAQKDAVTAYVSTIKEAARQNREGGEIRATTRQRVLDAKRTLLATGEPENTPFTPLPANAKTVAQPDTFAQQARDTKAQTRAANLQAYRDSLKSMSDDDLAGRVKASTGQERQALLAEIGSRRAGTTDASVAFAKGTTVDAFDAQGNLRAKGAVVEHNAGYVKLMTTDGKQLKLPETQVKLSETPAAAPAPEALKATPSTPATPRDVISAVVDEMSKGRQLDDPHVKALEAFSGRKLAGLSPEDQITQLKGFLATPATPKAAPEVQADWKDGLRKLGYNESQIAAADPDTAKLIVAKGLKSPASDKAAPAPKGPDTAADIKPGVVPNTAAKEAPSQASGSGANVTHVESAGEHWVSQVQELDAKGAPDSEYQGILATGSKARLKAGETWRDRVLAYAQDEGVNVAHLATKPSTDEALPGITPVPAAPKSKDLDMDKLQAIQDISARLSKKGYQASVELVQQALKDQPDLAPAERLARGHAAMQLLEKGVNAQDPMAVANAKKLIKGYDVPDSGTTMRGSLFGLDIVTQKLWDKLRPQQIPVDSPELQAILDKQRGKSNQVGPTMWERVAALPHAAIETLGQKTSGLIQTLGDKATLLPKASPLRSAMLQKLVPSAWVDPRLAGSMDRVSQQVGRPLDPSETPHASYWMNTGGGGGWAEAAHIELTKIHSDALRAGLGDHTEAYLNLTGYKDALDTVSGHRDTAVLQLKELQAQQDVLRRRQSAGLINAQDRGNSEVKLASLKSDIKDLRASIKDYTARIQSGEVNPSKMTYDKIAVQMADLKQQLGPERFSQVEELGKRYFDLMRSGLDLAHDAGIVGDEGYQKFTSRDSYVPLQRIMGEQLDKNEFFRGAREDLTNQKIIRKLEGSARTNLSPFQAAHDQLGRTSLDVARNNAAKDLVTYLQQDPAYAQDLRPVSDTSKLSADEGYVSFYHGGQKYTYALPKGMAEVFAAAKPAELSIFGKLGQLARNVFTSGTTLANTAFAIPNAARDIQDMIQLSKAGPKTIGDWTSIASKWTRAAAQVAMQSPEYLEMLRSGAAFSGMQRAITPEAFEGARAPVSNSVQWTADKLMHPIRTIADFNNVFEQATKLTAWKELQERGWDPKAAAWEVRNFGGSPDFARHGTASSLANLMFMFFNANIQGIGRTFNRLSSDPAETMKLLGTHTLAMAAMHQWNSQFRDQDGQALWDRIPAYDKQNYYNLIISHNQKQTAQGAQVPEYIRFPKGHVGQIVDNAIQDTLEHVFYGGEAQSVYQNAINVATNIIPGQVVLRQGHMTEDLTRNTIASANPILREGVEQMTGPGGTDYFRNSPIEPRHLNNLSANDAYVPSTSVTMRRIAGAINDHTDLSTMPGLGPTLTRPMRLQHAVENATGGLGQTVLNVTDALQGQSKLDSNGVPYEGSERLRHIPVLGPIAGRFTGSNVDAREHDLNEGFYAALQKAQQAKGHIDQMRSTNPQAAEDLANNEDFVRQVAAYKPLQVISEKLAASRRDQMRILADPSVSVTTKREISGQLYEQRMQLLKMVKDNGLMQ
jgi:hypothetical protein